MGPNNPPTTLTVHSRLLVVPVSIFNLWVDRTRPYRLPRRPFVVAAGVVVVSPVMGGRGPASSPTVLVRLSGCLGVSTSSSGVGVEARGGVAAPSLSLSSAWSPVANVTALVGVDARRSSSEMWATEARVCSLVHCFRTDSMVDADADADVSEVDSRGNND